MYENLLILENLPELGERLLFLAGVICVLVLGTVLLLLFASGLARTRGQEVKSRRKLGHKPSGRASSTGGFWKKIKGWYRSR